MANFGNRKMNSLYELTTEKMITIPFPVRNGYPLATLNLPKNLTHKEIQKLKKLLSLLGPNKKMLRDKSGRFISKT